MQASKKKSQPLVSRQQQLDQGLSPTRTLAEKVIREGLVQFNMESPKLKVFTRSQARSKELEQSHGRPQAQRSFSTPGSKLQSSLKKTYKLTQKFKPYQIPLVQKRSRGKSVPIKGAEDDYGIAGSVSKPKTIVNYQRHLSPEVTQQRGSRGQGSSSGSLRKSKNSRELSLGTESQFK